MLLSFFFKQTKKRNVLKIESMMLFMSCPLYVTILILKQPHQMFFHIACSTILNISNLPKYPENLHLFTSLCSLTYIEAWWSTKSCLFSSSELYTLLNLLLCWPRFFLNQIPGKPILIFKLPPFKPKTSRHDCYWLS
jgi:hypothetical protein